MKYYTSTTEYNCGIDLHAARCTSASLLSPQGKKLVHTNVKDNDFHLLPQARPAPLLQTVPGIGQTLGLTILYEVGDIDRFPTVKDFL